MLWLLWWSCCEHQVIQWQRLVRLLGVLPWVRLLDDQWNC
jgi:hypothetical protein